MAVITLDSTLKIDDSYYRQVFLKGCKYIEEKVVRHIHDNLSDFKYLYCTYIVLYITSNYRVKMVIEFKSQSKKSWVLSFS